MQYLALFLWFSLCLLLGALLFKVMRGPLSYRFLGMLSIPGIVIRKFSQTVAALLCAANVTDVKIYETDPRDITFETSGIGRIATLVVPLAPLFGSVLALGVLNSILGEPMHFAYAPPPLSSLDAGGLKGFVEGVGLLMSGLVRQTFQGDHTSPEFYVMLVLIFSLALGACQPIQKLREAFLGVGMLVVVLALLSGLVIPAGGMGPIKNAIASPGKAAYMVAGVRSFMVNCAGMAFALMLFGMLEAAVVGVLVRIYEMITGASTSSEGSSSMNTSARRA